MTDREIISTLASMNPLRPAYHLPIPPKAPSQPCSTQMLDMLGHLRFLKIGRHFEIEAHFLPIKILVVVTKLHFDFFDDSFLLIFLLIFLCILAKLSRP